MRALGARELVAFDLFVARRPPRGPLSRTTRAPGVRRVARPPRLAAQLAIAPLLVLATAVRRCRALTAVAIAAMALAEAGRRRGGGAPRFPAPRLGARAALGAERAATAWGALAMRITAAACGTRAARCASRRTPSGPAPERRAGGRARDRSRAIASAHRTECCVAQPVQQRCGARALGLPWPLQTASWCACSTPVPASPFARVAHDAFRASSWTTRSRASARGRRSGGARIASAPTRGSTMQRSPRTRPRPLRVCRRAPRVRKRLHHLHRRIPRARARRRARLRARAVVAASAPARSRRTLPSVGPARERRSGDPDVLVQRRRQRVLRRRPAPGASRARAGSPGRRWCSTRTNSSSICAPTAASHGCRPHPRARAAPRRRVQSESRRLRPPFRGPPVLWPPDGADVDLSVPAAPLTGRSADPDPAAKRDGLRAGMRRDARVVDPARRAGRRSGRVRRRRSARGLSNGRTFDYEETVALTAGNMLWSNRSSPLLSIVRDDVGTHDFLLDALQPRYVAALLRRSSRRRPRAVTGTWLPPWYRSGSSRTRSRPPSTFS